MSRSLSRDRGRRGRSRSYSRSPSRASPAPRSSKIVVEKLTKNVNEDHLREIFGAYGQIQDIDLPMNRQFNTNRGTAYIMYYEIADAERAIAHMHEAQLDGAVITVSIVLPRRRFSRSPPLRRGAPPFDRFDNRGGPPGGYRGPPPGAGSGRFRSPPRRRSPCQDPDHHDGAAQGLTLPDRSRELRLAGEEAMDAVRRHRGAGEEGADAEALATVATAATAIEVAAGAGTGAAEAGGSDWKA
ncbi:RNA-binding domain-containing protein [Lepidopterella palustris CBS 459.81]|uniref:RNA-binding domain-containing protein n=1 Tax=Lepidopterella palustris CBS 459.81 TaxID=1314670 RepID=A0A8E2JLF4_9PEZI|nr:RNA-binding domain-containing protein [Lepidopterella palustris CBS 459.81]